MKVSYPERVLSGVWMRYGMYKCECGVKVGREEEKRKREKVREKERDRERQRINVVDHVCIRTCSTSLL